MHKKSLIKVAVTGASGHVGNVLCRELIREGYQVRAAIHKTDLGLESTEIKKVPCDICNLEDVMHFVEGADIVFHLAAKISINGDPDGSVMQTNVEGTRNVVNACMAKKVKRLIHFSSIHSYRQSPVYEKLDEERDYVDSDAFAYDVSKALGEQIVLDAVVQGLDALILNPTGILGPFDHRPSLIGAILLDFYRGKFPPMVKMGFDWVDVRDVVIAALRAIEQGKRGERYILSGRWKSMQEIAKTSIQVLGKKRMVFIVPMWLIKIVVPLITWYMEKTKQFSNYTFEPIEIMLKSNRMVASCKAKKELGHDPRPFEETLRDTFEWFKTQSTT